MFYHITTMITEEQISNFINPVYWSLHLCNVAISEIKILSVPRESMVELSLVNNHTFSLYRSTLQYCFVMEYCKLLETDDRRRNHHVASLYRLNTKILHTKTTFKDIHMLNNSYLNEITNSKLCNSIKRLRDSKFAHSDKHAVNKPFEIAGFSLNMVEEVFLHLKTMKMVLIAE